MFSNEWKTAKQFADRFMNSRAEADMQGIIMAVLGVVVGAILISSLVPSQITTLTNASTSGWSTGTISTYNAVPILFVVAVLMIPVAIVLKLVK